jgi:hypothetical protein
LDAFAPDGQRIWTFPVDDFLGGPFEYEGHLIVPSINDSRIYCFAPGGDHGAG